MQRWSGSSSVPAEAAGRTKHHGRQTTHHHDHGGQRGVHPRPDRDQLVAAYRSGLSLRGLAEEFDVSRPTLTRWLVEAGVELRRSSCPELPASPVWWQAQLDAGRSPAELAAALSTTTTMVYRHLSRLGVSRPAAKPFEQWLADRTVVEDDCLRWTRARRGDGYPITFRDGREVGATRVVWEHHHGPISPKDAVSRVVGCPHRDCVKPDHLRLQTGLERGKHWAERAAYPRGEDHWNARLSEAEARAILSSPEPAEVLATRYGVRPHTNTSIRAKRRWSWLA